MQHQHVLITGGAGDLARATARLLLERGARVALLDRDREGLVRAEAELSAVPGAVLASVAADLARDDEVGRALVEGERALGGFTALVNMVGIFQAAPIVDLEAADWDRLMAVNLRSVFLACRQAVRRWTGRVGELRGGEARSGGAIVNVASLAGQVGGIVAGANYAASKAGVISLTRSLAKQTAGLGIRVNCINPGVIDSRLTREDWPPGRLEAMVKDIPLRRLGTPEDVAGAALFLLSEHASYIHGAQIDVNGGIHVG